MGLRRGNAKVCDKGGGGARTWARVWFFCMHANMHACSHSAHLLTHTVAVAGHYWSCEDNPNNPLHSCRMLQDGVVQVGAGKVMI